ncbi:DNA-processing protein DprA [Parafrankia sp. BMG5.11]|uniref:DNA-processing protein DprA n=1 Tax=Parafrankia sp. BMG5.11 TaxID=222540 RepID=UPI00103B928E|nr:DNA-processing protein DprA [Parafrankia sp. BMG5.11]TCJ36545.1 SMF family protein [Parafrankia sp. BMG5.11]
MPISLERRARAALTLLPPDRVRDTAVHTGGADAVRRPLSAGSDVDPDDLLAAHTAAGWRLLCPGDDEWPAALAPARGMPIALWARGDGHLAALTARSVTVTGTRSPSAHGVDHARRLTCGLVTAAPPVTVTAAVSAGIGLRALVGAAPHGPTIALLTSSAPACLARYGSLLGVVASRGVVLSVTPPLAPAPPGTGEPGRRLATRMTLLGALSPALLVVEAETAGQAMTLARAAHGRGRLVMAVPAGHRLTARHHGGCHQLLHGGLAIPAVTVDDITARLPTG